MAMQRDEAGRMKRIEQYAAEVAEQMRKNPRLSRDLTRGAMREVQKLDDRGAVVQTYRSVSAAARDVGRGTQNIAHAIRMGWKCAGWRWRYKAPKRFSI